MKARSFDSRTSFCVLKVFERIFERVSDEPDFEYALIDGTIVTAVPIRRGRRAALASTFVAGLEMARDGALAQEHAFGPVSLALLPSPPLAW